MATGACASVRGILVVGEKLLEHKATLSMGLMMMQQPWPSPLTHTYVIEVWGSFPLLRVELKLWPPPEQKKNGVFKPLASTADILFAIHWYHHSSHISYLC